MLKSYFQDLSEFLRLFFLSRNVSLGAQFLLRLILTILILIFDILILKLCPIFDGLPFIEYVNFRPHHL